MDTDFHKDLDRLIGKEESGMMGDTEEEMVMEVIPTVQQEIEAMRKVHVHWSYA